MPVLGVGGNAHGFASFEFLGFLAFDLVVASAAHGDEHLAPPWWMCQLLRHPGSKVTLWMEISGASSTGAR